MDLGIPRCPNGRICILGGGQLARMMVKKARRLGLYTIILDPTPDSPAGQIADEQLVGSYRDPAMVRQAVCKADVTTYDIEHIHVEVLKELAAEGHCIEPGPQVLEVIQDKLAQKQLFASHGLATPEFVQVDEPSAAAMEAFGYPLVQKLRHGGYDGRGVAVLDSPDDLALMLDGPSVLERKVDLERELAVIVARGSDGQMRSYPVVEMEVNAEANILDLLLSPARIDEATRRRAVELAEATVQALAGVGVFGVELFLDRSGEVSLNEVAPRPHNSGHYSYEGCITSQFEQHLRAVVGLPLGVTDQLRPAAMINLLGEPDYEGEPVVEGMADVLGLPGVIIHLYGKQSCRPFRKMGHVTVLADTLEQARSTALEVKTRLKIRGDTAI